MTITQNLDELCLDALKEVGNIGAGNAMTSLAIMLDKKVDMSIPRVGVMELYEFAQLAGGMENLAVGVYMPVAGDAPGHIAFILPFDSACHLIDQLMYLPPGTTQELDEIACSAILEIGNILASSYLVALCNLTGLNLLSSPPSLAIDMTASILSAVACAFADMGDKALTIVTQMEEDFGMVEGYFIYVPEPESLHSILRALQLEV